PRSVSRFGATFFVCVGSASSNALRLRRWFHSVCGVHLRASDDIFPGRIFWHWRGLGGIVQLCSMAGSALFVVPRGCHWYVVSGRCSRRNHSGVCRELYPSALRECSGGLALSFDASRQYFRCHGQWLADPHFRHGTGSLSSGFLSP